MREYQSLRSEDHRNERSDSLGSIKMTADIEKGGSEKANGVELDQRLKRIYVKGFSLRGKSSEDIEESVYFTEKLHFCYAIK